MPDVLITPYPSMDPFEHPASHDQPPSAWEVFLVTDAGVVKYGVDPGEYGTDLAELLTDVLKEHPGVRIGFQSEETKRLGYDFDFREPERLRDDLMEIVVDETPDDAENTDDHPLEEVRTAIDMALEAIPTPPYL